MVIEFCRKGFFKKISTTFHPPYPHHASIHPVQSLGCAAEAVDWSIRPGSDQHGNAHQDHHGHQDHHDHHDYHESITTQFIIIIPDICHRHHRHVCVKKIAWCKFLQIFTRKIGVFCIFNAKNWRFFTDLTRKIGVFGCKFYSPKIVSV